MWGPWIIWIQGPRPVSRETIVECDMVGPLPAGDFDWLCPGDPIARYRAILGVVRRLLADIDALERDGRKGCADD